MRTLLVPVDFSPITSRATDIAGNLALATGAKLVLIHIAPSYFCDYSAENYADVAIAGMDRQSIADQLRQRHRQLQSLAEDMKLRGVNVEALLIEGPTVDKICQEVSRRRADMIVMGSHGHGQLHDMLVGSVSKGVIRKANVPVLIIPRVKKLAPVMA